MRTRWVAAAAWVVAAALFVGWGWALVAAAAAAVLVVGLGRPRLAGMVTIGIVAVIGAVIVWVVLDERPGRMPAGRHVSSGCTVSGSSPLSRRPARSILSSKTSNSELACESQ